MGNATLVRGATGRVQVKLYTGDVPSTPTEDLTGWDVSVYATLPPNLPAPVVTVDYPALGEIELYWDKTVTPRLPAGPLAYTVQLSVISLAGDREIIDIGCDVK